MQAAYTDHVWLCKITYLLLKPVVLQSKTECAAVGDWAAKTAPDSGRIMAAQFSVACGLPLSMILLKGLPTEDPHGFTDSLAPRYAIVMALFGLLISWWAHSAWTDPIGAAA